MSFLLSVICKAAEPARITDADAVAVTLRDKMTPPVACSVMPLLNEDAPLLKTMFLLVLVA